MPNLVPEDQSSGVFELLTTLCVQESLKCSSNSSLKRQANKMRSHAYEVLLKKSTKDIPSSGQDAITALLTYYLVTQQNAKNVIEFKRNVELKKVISTIRCTDFGEYQENVYSVLKFLVALAGTIQHDTSTEIYKKPFTFGLLDEMLPRPPQQSFGSPQPYPFYPATVFQLPYSIRNEARFLDHQLFVPSQQFSIENFNTKSRLFERNIKPEQKTSTREYLGSLPSTSTNIAYHSEPSSIFNFSKLTGPRDLSIPKKFDPNVIITLPETTEGSVDKMYVAIPKETAGSPMDIWEIATQIDKNIPDDIWDIASELPPLKERQLIATSCREMRLWKQTYCNQMNDLNIISEKQFVRHIMYLLIGIETNCFPYNSEANCFQMKPDLVLEGITREVLTGYIINLLQVGSYYRRLYDFAFNQSLDDQFYSKGLVYEAGREVIRRYLLKFRMKVSEMYDEQLLFDGRLCMPTLLQILYKVEPFKYEIETIVSIYKLINTELEGTLPVGAELMSYLFNEISLVTNETTAHTMFTALFSICKVYFKFIEKFIFEGELNDQYQEFFIRKDTNYVNCRSKRYWDKGFHITKSVAVPEFLRSLAKLILLCGKSLRLLKLCNPSDPLILLISSDHPSVKCCASFYELERQQELLNVYRTRCLFVSGEPVTFDQILLKKEAARKAFTEMASLKQAETLEKIIAERKRLAQLIIAEKQHSLRVLEAAMAEAKAAKMNSKYREKRLQVLEQAAGKATEEVDSKLKEDERNKMMEYYSKLNMEVEKSKIHSEWKIKRLQLDQSRMQLLSTEERNLRRERIELQHKQNEECMAMSIQSIDTEDNKIDDLDTNDFDEANEIKAEKNSLEIPQKQTTSEFDANKHKSKRSNEVFTAICNVAKSIFGGSKKQCDNEKELDSQGNVLLTVSETELNLSLPPSDTDLEANDNENFINTRHDAFLNKHKGMGHEYTRTDHENNKVLDHLDEENNYKDRTSYLTDAEKNKLKVLGTDYNLAPIQTTKVEPRNDAQREAIINREKILGSEYYLPAVEKVTVEPKTDAHRVALLNKEKILGTEFYSASTEIVKQEPQNEAQREALLNKEKILGTEYNLPPVDRINLGPKTDAHRVALQNKEKILGTEFYLAPTEIAKKEPQNDAQREAVLNKEKILGTEYNLPPVDRINLGPKTDAHRVALQNKEKILGTEFYSAPTEIAKIEPQNDAQREAVLNKEKILGTDFYLPATENIFSEPITEAQKKAALNKNKILSTEFYLAPVEISEIEPKNDAQREALINKQKILGVEYNLPPKVPIIKGPKNYAQEEAIKNKEKILKGEFDPVDKSVVKRQPAKRSNLTLNLIPFSDTGSTGATPNIGALTPAEFYPRLDLETPTTAEVPFEGGTGDVFPHHSHAVQNDDDEISAGSNDKKINSEGFDFSIIVDEDTIDNELSDLYTPQNSPVKNLDVQTKNNLKIKYSFFDILEGTYSLDNFDPFGVKGLEKFSSDYFSNQMNNEMASSIYSHPAQIMSEVKKKPYENIFIRNSSHLGFTDDDDQKISSDNIATLTACLQRSVMLPLTYQLEVVNNSILTHFLVNLDMYEHMRSLKDYFFLMDGEFSRSICHNLFFKLGKTLNPEELLNFATLHNILDKALGSSISHIHKFSENLSFTISDTPLSFHHSSPDILQCLSLTYTVSWPLNIILSQEALARYAKVFQFLIKMRRISWVLSEGFESLKLTAKLTKQLSRKLIRSSQYISIQIYRHNMASLIRSLDNYIVTTCILSSWTEFETDLKKARTLDDLYDCHVVYIKKVLFRCLLNNRSTPVMKLLNDIFTVILKFTRVLKAGEWQQKRTNGEYTHSNHVQLVELYYLFEKLAKYLHKVITKLMECGYQRHLVELLTLINLNQYYEADRSKEETNTSIQSPV